MSQVQADNSLSLPAHVPHALVRSFDFTSGEGMRSCPHEIMARLQDGPRIFFNSTGVNPDGSTGYWVPTRAEDLRSVLLRTEIFSSERIARFSTLMGESWDLIPAEIDPPQHAKYRKLLNPFFSPSAISKLEGRVRDHATTLIKRVHLAASCEFITAFARPFPILIFMSIMGLPLERFDDVVAWGHDLHEGTTIPQRMRGATAIGGFLRAEIETVRVSPRDDLLSKIVHAKIDDRSLNKDEIIGIIYLLFAGGIHTVTASLGFAAQHLARDQPLQKRLRTNPSDIPSAIEELTRAYSVVHSFRRVVQDVELGGVMMKTGDWLKNTLPIGNLDRSEFPNPETVDIDRKPNRHIGFSTGIHFCLGVHLARFEMAIAWEEWLARVPAFQVIEAETLVTSGVLLGIDHLMLVW